MTSVLSCDQLCPITADHISVAPSMPHTSAHQCTSMPHISAYQCTSMTYQ
ncbi:unnamed protein product [Staurois parvus]|uniref:Uncharacterized protein n=1 Tax=Staurois parvus TaxID=386267 RepID=A0ABN9EAJ1_9NEOB|nr:unnamed protein product [Staurois parvus]